MSSEGRSSGEFGFELRFCAWAEHHWPPEEPSSPVVVGRQVGTQSRRWDSLIVETDTASLERRSEFGPETLDSDLLHVVRHAPAEWTWYRDALPHPGYPWRHVREAVHRAAERGVVETHRDGNRIQIRRIGRYPSWVNRLIAVEHKPDLDASAARALTDQLERDVALGLADEVWLATGSTGDRIEPALLADIPVEAGVMVVDDSDGFDVGVRWLPRSLAVDAPGTKILDRPGGGDRDRSAARFEYMDPAEKERRRVELAERVYGRGWRSYLETMRSDCRYFTVTRTENGYVPYCRAKHREQTARECSGSCAEFEPEPPAWRQQDWPLDGGPGAAVERVLAARRRRERSGE